MTTEQILKEANDLLQEQPFTKATIVSEDVTLLETEKGRKILYENKEKKFSKFFKGYKRVKLSEYKDYFKQEEKES